MAYDYKQMMREREALLSDKSRGEGCGITEQRAAIEESWRRCFDGGLHPYMPPHVWEARERAGYRPNLNQNFIQGELFEEFERDLARLGAVIYVLLDDGSVLYCGGQTKLRSQLKERGIYEATDFSEKGLGTTAAALCALTGKESWVVGAEHYLDCLWDCSTFACRVESGFSRYIMCLAMPLESRHIIFESLCRYFLRLSGLSAEVYKKELERAKTEILFTQLKDSLSDALILVNFSRQIICVNKTFESLFDIPQTDIMGRHLTEIFPELESFTSCLLTGQGVRFAEVQFEGLPKNNKTMYVSSTPWQRNGILDGMIITITGNAKLAKVNDARARFKDAYSFDDFIGSSRLFQETKEMARSVSKSNSSIILTGESGTGKELFAKAVHNASLRVGKPFVTVNCSAIPRELIGSELFGYVEGAFTGAKKGGNMGKFEYAHGGTLFLDEVGELPLEVQAVLLRVLEERTVVRIGSNVPVSVDVRIVSATNRNLMQMVKDNQFRLDLYYRLNVITIEIPPLRKRPEDIPLLVNYYLDVFGTAHGKVVSYISPETMECLVDYAWPGNVRQLRNVMERGVAMADTNELRPEHLPAELRCQADPAALFSPGGFAPSSPGDLAPTPDLAQAQSSRGQKSYVEWEREKIWALMQKYKANKSKMAAELGISRGTLYKKLRAYGF